MKYLTLFSIAAFIASLQAQDVTNDQAGNNNATTTVLINCTWPCPTPSDACVITSEGASCQARAQGQWIIPAEGKTPTYTDAYAFRPMQSCSAAPMPNLTVVDAGTTPGAGQSVVTWPPQLEQDRPLDHYLGNCNGGMYCSSAGDDSANPVCRIREKPGAACNSANQCYSRLCVNNVCQSSNDNKVERRRHHLRRRRYD